MGQGEGGSTCNKGVLKIRRAGCKGGNWREYPLGVSFLCSDLFSAAQWPSIRNGATRKEIFERAFLDFLWSRLSQIPFPANLVCQSGGLKAGCVKVRCHNDSI